MRKAPLHFMIRPIDRPAPCHREVVGGFAHDQGGAERDGFVVSQQSPPSAYGTLI